MSEAITGGLVPVEFHWLHELEVPALEAQRVPLLGRPILVRGQAHLLAGYPKAGKSEIVSHSLPGWLGTGEFVVILTEEWTPTWADRRLFLEERYGPLPPHCQIVHTPDYKERELRGAIERHGELTLLVVDTARDTFQFDKEQDAAEVKRRMRPWVSWCEKHGVTLLVIHHHRKADGSNGERVAGSHAFTGTVSNIMELRIDDQGRRILRAHGRRDFGFPDLLVEQDDDGTLSIPGVAWMVDDNEARGRIRKVLTKGWATTREITEKCGGISRQKIHKHLVRMLNSHEILRDPAPPAPVVGVLVRWSLVAPVQLPVPPGVHGGGVQVKPEEKPLTDKEFGLLG